MGNNFIPLSVPSIHGNEWKYVKECLDKEWVSSAGKFVDEFEDRIAEYTGAEHAVACVNGTAALHVALELVGVMRSDEVIVPTMTFIAPVNTIRYMGCEPVFMDCDDYYNIDAGKTIEFLERETIFRNGNTFNKTTERRISAIIPVHVFGNAADLEKLYDICLERNIPIVEDATESLGTVYSGGRFDSRHAGTIGAIGCLSFNGNKIITSGGGGMVLTSDETLADKAKYLTTQAKDDDVRYIHNEIGYNYRLTNIQAALGVAQLEQLPRYLETKEKNYETYRKYIDAIPGLRLADLPAYARNNHWMYAMQIDYSIFGKDREALMNYLTKNSIQARPIWYLNHMQKQYSECQTYRIERANELAEVTLNIPCSVSLTKDEILTVVEKLKHA